jgi:hypothetical protein
VAAGARAATAATGGRAVVGGAGCGRPDGGGRGRERAAWEAERRPAAREADAGRGRR